MRKANQLLLAALTGVALCLSNAQLSAQDRPQGRGNFDPEQMRQRMNERIRERLEITKDDEWKIIQARVEKIAEIRMEMGGRGMGMGPGFGRGGRRGGEGDRPPGDANQRPPRGFGGEPSPEEEALQKAIDGKASSDELKAKLAKVREARKEKEAKLQQAQEELRKVLTVRQEAAAVLLGLLQ